jgi:DNA-binding HxlR family transcriptional regulator
VEKQRDDPVVRALEIVGYRWTLLIVRELLGGPRRFTELARSLPRANPKIITARLRELEAAGLVSREVFAEVPPRVEYSLTPPGRGLRPVIGALESWGEAVPLGRARSVRRRSR